MRNGSLKLQKGFTLVELIIVIIILSIIGMMTSNYISSGVELYSSIVERDKSLNSVRFVMERLRREVSNALPNSAIVPTDGQCLTFTPIVTSSVYSSDFPISPLTGNTGTISPIADYTFADGDKAVVYLLNASDLNSTDIVNEISGINEGKDIISFSMGVSFSLASPAKRVYIIRDNVSYYFSGTNLYRGSECDSGVLMAEDINGSFEISNATLQRNGLVQAKYNLNFDGQEVPVEQTLHINNTP